MSVSCECCVLSDRGLCDGLITRPEDSYRVCYVCDREVSIMRPRPTSGCCAMEGRDTDYRYLLITYISAVLANE